MAETTWSQLRDLIAQIELTLSSHAVIVAGNLLFLLLFKVELPMIPSRFRTRNMFESFEFL